MASGSGSAAPLRRRGLISCLHSPGCRANDATLPSDHGLITAIHKLIVGFYNEAFDRLPSKSDAMPDFRRLLTTGGGGSCLGLFNPVSNIILNTLALLRKNTCSSPPAAKRSKKRKAFDEIDYARPGADGRQMAGRSWGGLVHFLVAYFGCLTSEQAMPYIYWAGADLPLAVMLVQHDLYQQPHALDPDSARTQAALKSAAISEDHPDPDALVQLMATRVYTDRGVALLKKKLFAALEEGRRRLTSKNVRAIHRLLHRPYDDDDDDDGVAQRQRTTTTTSVDVSSDGSTITTTTVRRVGHPIASLRHITDDKLASCLTKAAAASYGSLKTTPSGGGGCGGGDACEYLQSLTTYLQGMIHDFYVTALTLLPMLPSGSLMRSILMAGHCYGSMDPVSNIIVNSIWYNKHGCPLPKSERAKIKHYNDVLDPLSLLRIEVHSLKGLTELAAFADPQFTVADCALENLCSAKCDIVNMLSSSSSRKNPFHEAAMAAGHPLPLQLGELHQQLLLMPVERNKLLSLMTEARNSGTVLPINGITSILDMVLSDSSRAQTPVLVHAPKLSLGEASSHRSNYEEQSRWFRSELERLLKEYMTQHLRELKYTLDFICGVEKSKTGHYPRLRTCYHVNFIAGCGLRLQKTLFFAEFWGSGRESKPKFCCPIPYPYASRCYSGMYKSRRIVYPDRAKYIQHDVRTGSVDGMLEMDLVYLSCERDVDREEKEDEESE